MRIGLLTSSRADYGIYKPLIKALLEDNAFSLKIIAFGTHLSPYHGYTIQNILADNYSVDYTISSLLVSDDESSIASSCAITSLKFADFWANYKEEFDLVLCLGDRFEMYAAVSAAIPFGVRFAHLYGGDTTIGAIDNIYRHMITLASSYHFVSLEQSGKRVAEIIGSNDNIYIIGNLSLDNVKDLKLLNKKEFEYKWGINLEIPTILVTVHPETIAPELNNQYLDEILKALRSIANEYQVIITMPNADTNGIIFRVGFNALKNELGDQLHLVENFGSQSYFTCMQYSKFLIGNTSSGIVEAASFNKYVINVGDRQKGRFAGENVLHVPFNSELIKSAICQARLLGEYQGVNPYFRNNVAQSILSILKELHSDKL